MIGGVILSALYMPPVGIWLVLMAVSAWGQREFYGLCSLTGVPVFRIVGMLCGCALITATFFTIGPRMDQIAAAYRWEQLVMLGTLIAIFLRQFPQKYNDKPFATIGCTLLGIWYVPVLFNFFTRLVFVWDGGCGRHVCETGRLMIFYLVLVVKMADTGAYLVGSTIGRHKLIPRISPKKTWEGFFGGILFGVAASCVFAHVMGYRLGEVNLPLAHALVLGGMLSLSGVAGDLFESLLKRTAGVKDSSSIFPGMGGVLDVLDSLLFSAPMLYVYVRILLI